MTVTVTVPVTVPVFVVAVVMAVRSRSQYAGTFLDLDRTHC